MKLLLTSGGLENQTIIQALLKLAGKPFDQLKVAFIPTASNVEEGDKWWLIDDLKKLQELRFLSVDIVDISALPKTIWQKRLEEADIFFVEGGNTCHLIYWIKKSGLSDLLPELLKTRIWVGVSAGSVVVTKDISLSDSQRLYGENDDMDNNAGLGYLDFHIRPHLNNNFFPKMTLENMQKIADETKESIYALDDNSALVVINGKISVISEGIWKKFN
ncbi:MAG: Type 1 glutamine amidotransferase-like domain-containing protein [Candidatus Daviesbacteria bacterium]|nr:Type 1 glutamine amidotransferase-like domain-containing protein [Candidatus Daviesbacteria bacterium]